MPVVFADGSTAEIVYPPKLKIAQLGPQPNIAVAIDKGKRLLHYRDLLIGQFPTRRLASGPAVRTYEGPTGVVKVRRAKDPEDFLSPLLMHFTIGAWNVVVHDGNAGNFMGPKNRRLWAENLDGYETGGGFIVIEPRPPLAFAGGPGGPGLLLHKCFRLVEFRLEECKDLKNARLAKKQRAEVVNGVTVHRSENGQTFYANWCTPSRQVSVYLDDHNGRFVDQAVRGLQVRNVDVNENAHFAEF